MRMCNERPKHERRAAHADLRRPVARSVMLKRAKAYDVIGLRDAEKSLPAMAYRSVVVREGQWSGTIGGDQLLAQGLESPEGHEMERAESKTRQRSKSTLIVNQTVVTFRMLTCGTFLKGRCRTVQG